MGGSTNSKEIANQGKTIPVCQELPFAGSYYKENFLGGGTDAFISKIYYGECLTTSVTSPSDQIRVLEIQPNPATDIIFLKAPMLMKDGSKILLFDGTGKVVSSFVLSGQNSNNEGISVEIESLPHGLYYVTLQYSGLTYSGKFVKM